MNVGGGATLAVTGSSGNTIGGLVTVSGDSTASAQGTIDLAVAGPTTTVLTPSGGLTIGGSSTGSVSLLNFNASVADSINLGSGALTGNAGGGVINIGTTSLNPGTYNLIDYGSESGLTPGTNLTVGPTHPSTLFTSYTLSLSSTSGAGALQLTVTGTSVPNAAYWTGGQGGAYNWGDNNGISSTNWATSSAGTTDTGQLPGKNTDVVFAASTASSGSLTTNLEQGYTINSLTVLATGPAANSAVVIGGTGSLTLQAQSSATAGQNGSSVAGLGYAAGTGIVISSGAAGLTINTSGSVSVGGNQSWTNASSNLFSVTSGISGTAASGTTCSDPEQFGQRRHDPQRRDRRRFERWEPGAWSSTIRAAGRRSSRHEHLFRRNDPECGGAGHQQRLRHRQRHADDHQRHDRQHQQREAPSR